MHIIPAFAFTDQNNQAVTEKTFDNKIYVANFFFTTCGAVCPIMTNNLLKVEKTFPGMIASLLFLTALRRG
ncbi:MAG: SCO family protein [Chitinophagaceae bacterium]